MYVSIMTYIIWLFFNELDYFNVFNESNQSFVITSNRTESMSFTNNTNTLLQLTLVIFVYWRFKVDLGPG